MGAVYLARDTALERLVAIKVLLLDRSEDAASRERFRREARTAARLTHPNIVPLHGFGEADGMLYLVMGYVQGEPLSVRMRRGARLSLVAARRVGAEIADALDHAHGRVRHLHHLDLFRRDAAGQFLFCHWLAPRFEFRRAD